MLKIESENIKPQIALEDHHIEDENLSAGKVKDGDHIGNNENLLAGKATCKGKKCKNGSIKRPSKTEETPEN